MGRGGGERSVDAKEGSVNIIAGFDALDEQGGWRLPKTSEKSREKRRDRLLFGGAVLLLAVSFAIAQSLPLWSAEEEREAVGVVRAIRGSVQLRRVESTLWTPAVVGQPLASGDVVATEVASATQLEVKGREFALGEHAQIVVDAPRLGTGMILSVELVKGELLVTGEAASRVAGTRASGVKI